MLKRRVPIAVFFLTTCALIITYLVYQSLQQTPRPKTTPLETDRLRDPITDNFPLAANGEVPALPPWIRAVDGIESETNKAPQNGDLYTPLFIGFTRNWPVLQQAVVSYITAGWPAKDIYVVDNTGTMGSNKHGRLTLQNPFYLDYARLTETLGVNVVETPTLLTFAQLQNFFLYTAIARDWEHYFWSHMDVLVLSDEDEGNEETHRSFYQRTVDVLRETLDTRGGRWATRFFGYDRLTLVKTAAYVDIGGFDPMIAYYNSDCDMYERLHMAGYSLNESYVGHVFDVGDTLEDLRVLYREDADFNRAHCGADASAENSHYGVGDCVYRALRRKGDEMQSDKGSRGRNYWQRKQSGGQGEPFHVDPEGFETALRMTMVFGRKIFGEKWGHRWCELREAGYGLEHAWHVNHDFWGEAG